jgi:hypothetical protein
MVKFTSMYVLYYQLTCTAHLQSDSAQIWCASMIVAYLGISEKYFCFKNEQNMKRKPENGLRFHVLSFSWSKQHKTFFFKPEKKYVFQLHIS